jgi:cbb3-type cytochrome oxidase cytochrome c subunit
MVNNNEETYQLQTIDSEKGYNTSIKWGNARDVADMMRLGKKQEFKRNFHAFSMLGLSSVLYVCGKTLVSSTD